MRKFLAIALATAMLATASTALAQRVDTVATSTRYVGDEPNTPTGNKLPYAIDDPSAEYPADANGLGAARLTSPDLILSSVYVQAATASAMPTSSFLHQLTTDNYMLPGPGQFWAWYGTWQDNNGDGFIAHHTDTNRVHVSTLGDCETTPSTTDENGLGKPQGANTGISARCVYTAGEEFVPAEKPATGIVAYVTPGYYSGYADYVNIDRVNDTNVPDFTFSGPVGADGENSGRYFAPTSNFEYVMLDSSLVETTVLEAISSPVVVQDGDRTHEAGPDSLVEVDVYTSVDPTVEALYQSNIAGPLRSAGCEVDWSDLGNGCPTVTYDEVQEIEDTLTILPSTAALTGPADDAVYPKFETEVTGYDYADPHLYIDLRLVVGSGASSVSGAVTHSQSTSFNGEAVGGERRPVGQAEVHAYFGVWHDKNEDGFIGKPVTDAEAADTSDPCEQDPWECGNVDDPNAYTITTSEEEWLPVCGAAETLAGKGAQGHFIATVESSTNSWGAGVYLLTDRRTAGNADADELKDDGRSPFNPYDDVVLYASEGNTNGFLVTSGPISIHMLCTDNEGLYYGYERMVFLGTNQGYDITVRGGTSLASSVAGVPTTENVSDSDTIGAFAL